MYINDVYIILMEFMITLLNVIQLNSTSLISIYIVILSLSSI